MDANGFEETGAAGVMTATDWLSKSIIVFRGAEVVELLRAHLLGADKGFIIYVLEMLAVVGLASVTATLWRGKVVVFITDNDNVKCAINSRSSSSPYVRYLLRVLGALGDVFDFRYYAVFIWTHNNWIEDGAGRMSEMLAARNDFELQAAGRQWYGPIFGPDHQLLSVETLKAFVRGGSDPLEALMSGATDHASRAAFRLAFAKPSPAAFEEPLAGFFEGPGCVTYFGAGIGALMTAMQDRGLPTGFTVEANAGKREVLATMAPGAQHFGDHRAREWEAWRGPDVLVVVTAWPFGAKTRPSPTLLATSLGHTLEVIRANQGGRGVLSVVVEAAAAAVNSPVLIEELDLMMRRAGFVRSVDPRGGLDMVDPADAGFAQPRPRLALVYDRANVVDLLGHATRFGTTTVTRQSVRDLLDPVGEVLDHLEVHMSSVSERAPLLKVRGPAVCAFLTF